MLKPNPRSSDSNPGQRTSKPNQNNRISVSDCLELVKSEMQKASDTKSKCFILNNI